MVISQEFQRARWKILIRLRLDTHRKVRWQNQEDDGVLQGSEPLLVVSHDGSLDHCLKVVYNVNTQLVIAWLHEMGLLSNYCLLGGGWMGRRTISCVIQDKGKTLAWSSQEDRAGTAGPQKDAK